MNDSTQISAYAGALLITPAGEIITQHRDNIPSIQFPGSLSVFGGRVEEGEKIEEALIREIKEETLLDLTKHPYEFYKVFRQRIAKTPVVPKDVDCHIFIVTNIEPQSISVQEGQGYVLLKKDSDLEQYTFSPTMREIFEDYLAR